ncbi:MAG: NAD(P)H-binding protein, partial [Chloroflexi bacterium]|nr:NAD(P)H-binding protein [Chloroflexota bacterium]
METAGLSAVTGAFGYTGKYIAQRLLSMGKTVKTLTGHPNRPNPFGERVSVAPLNFGNSEELVRSLQGAEVLYNTYWIRFPRGQVTFDKAVENTKTLIKAAEDAGVRRIVHVSITNASADSPLPYFKGKGIVEQAIRSSRLSYAIVRPTVIFGIEDILINNIAWFLRRVPVFAIFGSGAYRIQPIFVEDVAEIAVRAAHQSDNVTLDATGPETITFEGLVRLIANKIGSRARLIHVRPGLALFLSRLMGYAVRDVVLTRDEMEGLIANLLISEGPP